MNPTKILLAPIYLTLAFGYSNSTWAIDDAPIEILNFAAQNSMSLQKSAPVVINKYPLAGKTVALTGKLSISGSASYKGHSYPFSAPGDKKTTQHITYIFDQAQADGSLPFHLHHLYGNFDGMMTPAKPDKYELHMNDPQGSMLSSLAYYAQTSSDNTWKNTAYSYTAVASQKKTKGVATTYIEIKEKASFRISIPGLQGAVANYTYSYDWKAAAE